MTMLLLYNKYRSINTKKSTNTTNESTPIVFNNNHIKINQEKNLYEGSAICNYWSMEAEEEAFIVAENFWVRNRYQLNKPI